MKEKQENTTGLSSMLMHVRVKLETKYIHKQELMPEVTDNVFAPVTEFLSSGSSKYIINNLGI